MAGSLKTTCTVGQSRRANTAALSTLTSQTACGCQFWIQPETWDTGFNGSVFTFTGGPTFNVSAFSGNLEFSARNAGNTNILVKSIPITTIGHHVLFSYVSV